ncbi:Trimethylguanosine synthase [Actinomortierella ambigua]|nr:Trimethylguanosine synthase [Actinomortierella ambigua]
MVKSKAKRKELALLGRIKNAHHPDTSLDGNESPTTALSHSKKERRKEKRQAKKIRRLARAQRDHVELEDSEDGDEPPLLIPISQTVVATSIPTGTPKRKKEKTKASTGEHVLPSNVVQARQPAPSLASKCVEKQQDENADHQEPRELHGEGHEEEDEFPEEYPLLFKSIESRIPGTDLVASRMQGYQPMPSQKNKRSASEASLSGSEDDSNTASERNQLYESGDGEARDHTGQDNGGADDRAIKRVRTEDASAALEAYQVQQTRDSISERRVRYTKPSQLPTDMAKYWHQRYRYFSLYDEGVHMDKEGWYSVTPEKIASHIAERCACDVIIDAFCGVGGNAIQFALTCHRVIAIDIDPVRLDCAKHNARIYGVEDRIEFILGDYMTLIPRLKADVVFLSPPWGGPSYSEREFDIKQDIPMDGEYLFRETQKITPHIAYYLPRNSNAEQIGRLAGEGETCEINKNVLNGACKAWTAYFGELQLEHGEGEEEANADGEEHVEDAVVEEEDCGGWGSFAAVSEANSNGRSGKKKRRSKKK